MSTETKFLVALVASMLVIAVGIVMIVMVMPKSSVNEKDACVATYVATNQSGMIGTC